MNILFKNWHFMRYFRLALALFLGYEAVRTHEWFFMAFAAFFLFQAIFNFGCRSQSCTVPQKRSKK
ncbi:MULTISPECIES: hypothetical protein [Flavobacterium]|uniref:hypothetical protein n=1 Tax=Flavobacterium TaxID=237 RepID=UPI001FCBD381|nr:MULTISPECIES: hypothetical protein [Flavobacterium]UOK43017.1 hypothetical protein LZF87_02595 [Flavobacterium enshiense]